MSSVLSCVAGVQWLGVLLSAAAAFILAALWYSDAMFGERFRAAIGRSDEPARPPARALILCFLNLLLQAAVLSIVLQWLGSIGLAQGALVGGLLSAGLIATSMYGDELFTGAPNALLLIQGGYRIVSCTLMAALLSMWA